MNTGYGKCGTIICNSCDTCEKLNQEVVRLNLGVMVSCTVGPNGEVIGIVEPGINKLAKKKYSKARYE